MNKSVPSSAKQREITTFTVLMANFINATVNHFLFEKRFLRKECKEHSIVCITALVIIDKIVLVVH